jgi:hypothetical protein
MKASDVRKWSTSALGALLSETGTPIPTEQVAQCIQIRSGVRRDKTFAPVGNQNTSPRTSSLYLGQYTEHYIPAPRVIRPIANKATTASLHIPHNSLFANHLIILRYVTLTADVITKIINNNWMSNDHLCFVL